MLSFHPRHGVAVLALSTLLAIQHQTTPAINEADLKHRLYLIAHDSMGGRPTGSPGHIKVTDYMAAEFKRLGLRPGGENGTYFQNVPFVRRAGTTTELSVAGAPLAVRTDYVAQLSGAPPKPFTDVSVVYGGVIDDSTSWISADQAAGKVVVFRISSLQVLQRGFPSASRHPRFANAAAVVLTGFGPVFPQIAQFVGQTGGPVYKDPAAPSGQFPAAFFASDATAAKLLGAAPATLQPGAAGTKVTGRVTWTEEQVVARNVVAILPGSDPALRAQYVAVTAHIDHDPIAPFAVDHDSLRAANTEARKLALQLGREPSPQERAQIRINLDSIRKLRPARRDSILNGADDDGSGTVALLEIAEAMARNATKPKRSIIFVGHVAEELGLIGARHFTDHPTVPRDSIVTALNMDMIGRGGSGEEVAGGPTYLQLIGWRRLSNELGDIIDAVNKQRKQPFQFDLQYDAAGHPEQFYCRSDHAMYARYGIPVSFFTTGSHGDYHEVTDEPQYIDYTKLMNVSQLVHDIAFRVAGQPQRPKVDGKVTGPNAPCVQ